jgi:hypothetical protein
MTRLHCFSSPTGIPGEWSRHEDNVAPASLLQRPASCNNLIHGANFPGLLPEFVAPAHHGPLARRVSHHKSYLPGYFEKATELAHRNS